MTNQITISSLHILEIINEYRGLRGLQAYPEHIMSAVVEDAIPCDEGKFNLVEAQIFLMILGEPEEVWRGVEAVFKKATEIG